MPKEIEGPLFQESLRSKTQHMLYVCSFMSFMKALQCDIHWKYILTSSKTCQTALRYLVFPRRTTRAHKASYSLKFILSTSVMYDIPDQDKSSQWSSTNMAEIDQCSIHYQIIQKSKHTVVLEMFLWFAWQHGAVPA
jgi:hypothetical protein